MPEYLIEVKSTKHGRKRKEKNFAPSSNEAEKQLTLEKAEYILSVSNNKQTKGRKDVLLLLLHNLKCFWAEPFECARM